MAQGWRQSWEDLIASLRGGPTRAPVVNPMAADTAGDAPDEGSADETGAAPDSAERAGPAGSDVTDLRQRNDAHADPAATEDVPSSRRRTHTQAIASAAAVAAFAALAWWGWQNTFGGRQADNPPVPDVVATFDGGRITLADVEAHMKLLAPTAADLLARSPEAMLTLVEDLISDQVILRWAAVRKPEGDESFRHAIRHIDEELSLDSLASQIHEETLTIPESDIRTFFDTNKDRFEGQTFEQAREGIRQILIAEREPEFIEAYVGRLRTNASITRNYELLDVPPPDDAELRRYYQQNVGSFALPRRAVVDELAFPVAVFGDAARQRADDALLRIRGGASFSETADRLEGARLSTGREVAEGTALADWDKAVFALVPGELGSVFQAGDSFYVVRLSDLKLARNQDLSEVRTIVAEAVARQKEQSWFAVNRAKTLFTIKSERYTVQQFYDEYRELPVSVQLGYSGPDGMRKLADALIDRMLLVADTYDQLLDVKTRPLADESRLRLLAQMMEQEEVDDRIDVSNAEVQDFYTQNRDRIAYPPKARIRYIRIGLGNTEDEERRARERADEAYRKLVPGLFAEGADFATVALDYSEDADSAAGGGELAGWVGEGSDPLAELMDHPFHQAVLALEPGEIGKPFQLGDSIYIVGVLARTEPEPLSLEEARPSIEAVLREQKHDDLAADLQDRLLKEIEVEVFPKVLETYFETRSAPAARNGL